MIKYDLPVTTIPTTTRIPPTTSPLLIYSDLSYMCNDFLFLKDIFKKSQTFVDMKSSLSLDS